MTTLRLFLDHRGAPGGCVGLLLGLGVLGHVGCVPDITLKEDTTGAGGAAATGAAGGPSTGTSGVGSASTGGSGGGGGEGVTTNASSAASTSTGTGGSGVGVSSSTSGGGPAACGDGLLQSGEACDDGNTMADDSCQADCKKLTLPPDIELPTVEPRVVDLDGDGVPEVVGHDGMGAILQFAGTPGAWIQKWKEPTSLSGRVSLGDFDGDTLLDVAISHLDGGGGYKGFATIHRFLTGSISNPVWWQYNGGTIWNVNVTGGDVNGDGRADLLVHGQGMSPTTVSSQLWLSTGSGMKLVDGSESVLGKTANGNIANVDNDPSVAEILVCGVDYCGSGGCGGPTQARLLRFNSMTQGLNVLWAAPKTEGDSDSDDQACRLADVNGDGRKDAVLISLKSPKRGLRVHLNSNGSLSAQPSTSIPNAVADELVCGFVDGDAREDCGFFYGPDSSSTVYYGTDSANAALVAGPKFSGKVTQLGPIPTMPGRTVVTAPVVPNGKSLARAVKGVVCAAMAPSCLEQLAGKCNSAGTALESATDCSASGKKCVLGTCK